MLLHAPTDHVEHPTWSASNLWCGEGKHALVGELVERSSLPVALEPGTPGVRVVAIGFEGESELGDREVDSRHESSVVEHFILRNDLDVDGPDNGEQLALEDGFEPRVGEHDRPACARDITSLGRSS